MSDQNGVEPAVQGVSTSVQAVANYFLDKAKKENRRDMTNLKIQKLVYIAYGFYSVIGGEKLFPDPIEAWKHGPVIPALYYEASRFGSKHIKEKFTIFHVIDNEDIETDLGDLKVELSFPKVDDGLIVEVLDYIWDCYSKYTGWTLRRLTHLKDTPWFNTFDDGQGKFNQIPFEEIRTYYQGFIDKIIGNDKNE